MPLPGFPEKDINMILRIMASLLHFGNVAIAEKDGESCEVPVSLSCVPFVLSPTSIEKYCGQKYLLSRLSVSLQRHHYMYFFVVDYQEVPHIYY